MNFSLNQIFIDTYPPEAAQYCNANGYMLKEISPLPQRKFQIVSIPEPTVAEKEAMVRSVRDSYLVATDKYMIVDFPISAETKAQYRAYRQYLRDYPTTNNWYSKNPKTYEEYTKQP